MKLHARIRALRIVAGLTQADVADAVGVSKAAVSSWERELSSPTAGHLPAIAKVLGVEVSELFDVAEEHAA